MKRLLLAAILTSPLILTGCATTARDNKIEFRVKSDPAGCPVEVNGINMGATPTNIYLGMSRFWVGLAFSSDGWDYGNETYQVTCFPPPDSREQLVSQSKLVQPKMTPQGADLYFNLRLRPYVPTQPIDIQKHGTEEITIRQEGSTETGERLKKLQKLRDDGLITEEEFKKKRDEILKAL